MHQKSGRAERSVRRRSNARSLSEGRGRPAELSVQTGGEPSGAVRPGLNEFAASLHTRFRPALLLYLPCAWSGRLLRDGQRAERAVLAEFGMRSRAETRERRREPAPPAAEICRAFAVLGEAG